MEAERDRVAATAPSRIRGNAVHQSATAKSRNEDQQHLDKSDICSESVNSCAEAWSCNSTSHLRAALPAHRPHEGRGGRARMGSCDHGRNRPVVRVPRRAEPMPRAERPCTCWASCWASGCHQFSSPPTQRLPEVCGHLANGAAAATAYDKLHVNTTLVQAGLLEGDPIRVQPRSDIFTRIRNSQPSSPRPLLPMCKTCNNSPTSSTQRYPESRAPWACLEDAPPNLPCIAERLPMNLAEPPVSETIQRNMYIYIVSCISSPASMAATVDPQ